MQQVCQVGAVVDPIDTFPMYNKAYIVVFLYLCDLKYKCDPFHPKNPLLKAERKKSFILNLKQNAIQTMYTNFLLKEAKTLTLVVL